VVERFRGLAFRVTIAFWAYLLSSGFLGAQANLNNGVSLLALNFNTATSKLVEHDGEWEKSPGTALQNEKKGANEY
jgi:hypothetical protein